MWVEPLEGRTLFAATTTLDVSQAYTAAIQADGFLRGDVGQARQALATDRALLTTDVRNLGNSPADVRLLRTATATTTRAVAGFNAAVNRYAARSEALYLRVADYNGEFNAAPGVKADRRLKAAQDLTRRVVVPKLAALSAVLARLAATVAPPLTALATATAGVTGAEVLTADLQRAMADLAGISTDADTNAATAATAVASLDGTADAPDPTATDGTTP